jgi:putative endonuclease
LAIIRRGGSYASLLSQGPFRENMYFAYVIRSQTVDKTYVGHTQDLEKRLKEHNDPTCFSSKFAKRFPGPWILIYSESYSTRSEAFRRERWFKTGAGREYLRSSLNRGF